MVIPRSSQPDTLIPHTTDGDTVYVQALLEVVIIVGQLLVFRIDETTSVSAGRPQATKRSGKAAPREVIAGVLSLVYTFCNAFGAS